MKAIVVHDFGGPEVLKVEDIAEPIPVAGEVRVKLAVAGVNPNEAYTRTGTYSFVPELPYTPGFDGAGIIDAVGAGVTDFAIGDRVFINASGTTKNTGTYAEKAVVIASAVYHLPEKLSFEEGASLGIPGLAAYQAIVSRSEVKAEDTVLIHGASGAVGLIAIQIAKALGAQVIGSSSTEEGRQLILNEGADAAINHVKIDQYDDIYAVTDGKGPDVIIEMLANKNLETDLNIINKFGRIIILGSRGKIEIDPRHTMGKGTDIRGMSSAYLTDQQKRDSFKDILRFVEEGKVKPLVGDRLDLDQARQAHEIILDKKGNGKLVLRIK